MEPIILKSVFHVKVNEASTTFLSFVSPFGQYEFCRAPFGFCNSPSVFMRYINLIFNHLIETGDVLCFMDNLLVTTTNFHDHIMVLQHVFEKMVENKLNLRLDKCSFGNREIEYLGYQVTVDGISPSHDNIKAVVDFPVPKNKKDLYSF